MWSIVCPGVAITLNSINWKFKISLSLINFVVPFIFEFGEYTFTVLKLNKSSMPEMWSLWLCVINNASKDKLFFFMKSIIGLDSAGSTTSACLFFSE